MRSRTELHALLLDFLPNAYFQPPSNITLKYPCIIYSKNGRSDKFGNNSRYSKKQIYTLTVIEKDPDSVVADDIIDSFQYSNIERRFTNDNLHHTIINLFF